TTSLCTLSLHDALPIYCPKSRTNKLIAIVVGNVIQDISRYRYFKRFAVPQYGQRRIPHKYFRTKEVLEPDNGLTVHFSDTIACRSEEHTSELQSRENIV